MPGHILLSAGIPLAGGVVGSISGLGGGIVIVPVLTLFMVIPIEQAIGASIVSVIAVSSGAGSVYVKDRITNIRIAMFLELSTASGALFGAAVLTRWVNPNFLSILFGAMLLVSLLPIIANIGEELPRGVRNDRLAAYLRLNGSYYDKRLQQEVFYNVTGIPAAMGLMAIAGIISRLLGIGAGVVKVLAHEIAMKVPTKVSTATSNFMIGVTAAAAAGVYLRRGHGITIQDASAWVLRVGVISSVIIMLAGTMISFIHHPVSVQYMEQTPFDDNAHDLLRGLRALRGQPIIELGIYVLVLTPILRVVTSMILFFLEEKDWLYTIVTLVVLILTLSGLLLLK